MAGPWEKYATPQAPQGPWMKYSQPQQPVQAQAAGPMAWEDVGSQAMQNLGPSALEAGKSFVQPFLHPIQTARGIADIGKGALQHAGIMEPGPEMEAASAVKQHFVDRYGNTERFKKTLATDPVGSFMDISTIALPARAPLVASKASRVAAKVPSVQKLKSDAGAKYTAAKRSGHVFSAQDYDSLVADIGQTLVNEGAHPKLHPKAVAVVQEMARYVGKPMGVQDMQTMRRLAKAVGKSLEPDERRLGQIIKTKIDAMIEPAVPEFAEANKLWSQAKKGEEIERLIATGERKGKSWFTGSGSENAIRRQFETMASNEKRMRGFSKAERKAIEKTAEGTRLQRVLRNVGKMAPTGVIPGLGGGAIYQLFGPHAAGAAMGVGATARMAATRATRNNAALASALARSGGKLPKVDNPEARARLAAALYQSGELTDERKLNRGMY